LARFTAFRRQVFRKSISFNINNLRLVVKILVDITQEMG